MPNLNQSARTPLVVIFSLGLAVMIVVSLVSSVVDPSDEAMVMYRNDREKYGYSEVDFKLGAKITKVSCFFVTTVRVM